MGREHRVNITYHKKSYAGNKKRSIVRRKAHFTSSHVTHSNMDEGQGDSKRMKGEAQMIPGVDGVRTWGFPNSIITKLRYADTYEGTGTSGARYQNVYRANGIFDPDATGTGHQPLYRDNWVNIYNNLRS